MSVDPETLAVYEARAADYAARFDNDQPGGALRRFMEALPTGGRILDIGCGTGASSAIMQQAGFQVACFDASAAMVDAARARGLDVRQASFEAIGDYADLDGVWANFSLLHAPLADLPRHFAAISDALKPGGIFHIGMKVGEGERRDSLGRKYSFITEDYLLGQFTAVNLTPFDLHAFSEAGLAGTVDPGLTMLARKDA